MALLKTVSSLSPAGAPRTPWCRTRRRARRSSPCTRRRWAGASSAASSCVGSPWAAGPARRGRTAHGGSAGFPPALARWRGCFAAHRCEPIARLRQQPRRVDHAALLRPGDPAMIPREWAGKKPTQERRQETCACGCEPTHLLHRLLRLLEQRLLPLGDGLGDLLAQHKELPALRPPGARLRTAGPTPRRPPDGQRADARRTFTFTSSSSASFFALAAAKRCFCSSVAGSAAATESTVVIAASGTRVLFRF